MTDPHVVSQSQDCLENGPPEVGANVDVRWTDGALYKGIFKGTNTHIMYTVSIRLSQTRK